jgi:hypothetical protein
LEKALQITELSAAMLPAKRRVISMAMGAVVTQQRI